MSNNILVSTLLSKRNWHDVPKWIKNDSLLSVRSCQFHQRWIHQASVYVAWFSVQAYLQGTAALSYSLWFLVHSLSPRFHRWSKKVIILSHSFNLSEFILMWIISFTFLYSSFDADLIDFFVIDFLKIIAISVTHYREFEEVVIYCDNLIKLIPLSFVLGFYVSYVAQRWWKQYKAIPWPDKWVL